MSGYLLICTWYGVVSVVDELLKRREEDGNSRCERVMPPNNRPAQPWWALAQF